MKKEELGHKFQWLYANGSEGDDKLVPQVIMKHGPTNSMKYWKRNESFKQGK